MKDRIVAFLTDLDNGLVTAAGGERLSLYHIGRSALVWKHGFIAATNDVDVVTPHGSERLMKEALRLFGKGTAKAREYGLYLENVPQGLPPVWKGCFDRAVEADGGWNVIRLFHPDDHDLVVTKLKRFSAKDWDDIRSLCDRDLLDVATLRARIRAAWPFHAEGSDKDDDPGAEAAFANCEVVCEYLEQGG